MGDFLRVTAPSGLKLRPSPSTDDATSAAILLMPIGTVVEAQGASDPDSPHFVNVYVDLTQPTFQNLTPENAAYVQAITKDGFDGISGFASADWLTPSDQPAQHIPGPIVPVVQPKPTPTPSPAPAAGMSTGVKVAIGVAILAGLYYAFK